MITMKTSTEPEKPVILFDLLERKHLRNDFDCNNDDLNTFIQKLALQYQKRQITNTFIAYDPKNPSRILGFYSVNSGSIKNEDFPGEIGRKLPKHPIPVILVARLAVDVTRQGKGIGKLLLFDALRRALNAANEIAANAVIVNAKDDNAKAFYEKYGFRELNNNPLSLFITMKEIEQVV